MVKFTLNTPCLSVSESKALNISLRKSTTLIGFIPLQIVVNPTTSVKRSVTQSKL